MISYVQDMSQPQYTESLQKSIEKEEVGLCSPSVILFGKLLYMCYLSSFVLCIVTDLNCNS